MKLETKVFGSHALFWIIVMAFLIFSGTVKADIAAAPTHNTWYIAAGIGSSEHHYRHDGFWVQQKVPHEEDDTQNMWSLGVGKEVASWLSAELTYYDLGQWSNFIKFCSDAAYDKDACRTNDDKWVAYGYGRGESKALAASVLPTFRYGKAAAFLRGGFTYYWTKYEVKHVSDGDAVLAPMNTYGNPTMVRGVGYIAGAGLEYNGIRAEYVAFPDLSGSDTAHDRVTALTVSAVWKF